MTRILITGGAGFIGSHIADRCVAAGHEVLVVDNLSSGRRENVPSSAKFVELDIRDRGELTRICDDFRPEAVSHHAAQASVSVSMRNPTLDAEANVVGGLHVLEASARAGAAKFVFASTGGAIYGDIREGSANENSKPDPVSPYAIHKNAFEMLLRTLSPQHGLKATILRYANVYGPRQDPHGEAGVVAIFARRALVGEDLTIFGMHESGDDGCTRDYVFVDDVVKANFAALVGAIEHPILNVATNLGTSTRELAERIVVAAKSTSRIVSGPPRAGDVARSVLDNSRFSALFEAPTPLERGLEKTLEWFAEDARRRVALS